MSVWRDAADELGGPSITGYYCGACLEMHYRTDYEYERHRPATGDRIAIYTLPIRERVYRAAVGPLIRRRSIPPNRFNRGTSC